MSAALRLATALSLMGFLAACDADEVNERVTLITNFGNAPEPVETQEPVQDPTPPQAANSNPVVPETVNEYDRWANEPGYVCQPVFRSLSCLDDGRPVYLDGNMNQLPFGEKP